MLCLRRSVLRTQEEALLSPPVHKGVEAQRGEGTCSGSHSEGKGTGPLGFWGLGTLLSQPQWEPLGSQAGNEEGDSRFVSPSWCREENGVRAGQVLVVAWLCGRGVGRQGDACRYAGLEWPGLGMGGWIWGAGKGGGKAGPWVSSRQNWVMGVVGGPVGGSRTQIGACSD